MNLSDRRQVYTDVYRHANNIRARKKKTAQQHCAVPEGEARKAHLTDGFQQRLPQLQPHSLLPMSVIPHCTTVVELTGSDISRYITKQSKHNLFMTMIPAETK